MNEPEQTVGGAEATRAAVREALRKGETREAVMGRLLGGGRPKGEARALVEGVAAEGSWGPGWSAWDFVEGRFAEGIPMGTVVGELVGAGWEMKQAWGWWRRCRMRRGGG
jgi:hypothetical protein